MNGYITRTYWINRLYPHNPSMDEELNRLLGWANYGSTIMACNEFVQNGTDSEYCPDDNQNSPEYCNVNNSSDSDTSLSASHSQQPMKNEPQQETQQVKREVKPYFPPSRSSGQVSSSIFLTANRARRSKTKKLHCSFCKNNGERELVYASHNLKTDDDGIIICPVLRNYTCPICKINGDNAHTLKYCPMRDKN